MKQDMERFEEMCKDGLLGPGDYEIFKDWLVINRSRDGYIHIGDCHRPWHCGGKHSLINVTIHQIANR
jgi:hypothetical protein